MDIQFRQIQQRLALATLEATGPAAAGAVGPRRALPFASMNKSAVTGYIELKLRMYASVSP